MKKKKEKLDAIKKEWEDEKNKFMAMAELQERINNQITYETDIEKNHVDL